jgi:nicotinamidase-related amidase
MKTPKVREAAIVLIDHQTGTMNFSKTIERKQLEAHTRALAKAAVAPGMPLVLTSSMEEILGVGQG